MSIAALNIYLMKEEFLHYVWKYGFYYSDRLKDEEDNPIEVIHPGDYNRDSGPDFFNARIRINGIEWAGNVEIHTRASHFDLHGHNHDHAFDNVILHVVADKDKRIRNARGQEVLTVAIEYDKSVSEKYQSLVNNPSLIACQDDIGKIDRLYLNQWLHSLLVERISEKSEMIRKTLSDTGNDWEETFYRSISRYFGFRVNTEPFEMLARALPFKIIRKHSDNRFQIEVLLFGTAGMLEKGLFKEAICDSYYIDLIKEYAVLSTKYSLKPIHGWLWKFSKLRPVNFPTVRISQLSAMLTVTGGLFSRLIEIQDIKDLRKILKVAASEYWDNHFVFGVKSSNIKKKSGESAVDILLINSVIPIIFIYGQVRGNPEISERALSFLENISPEMNSIIHEWKESGITPFSAFESQALIQLRNNYCRKRRCLECRIGHKLISLGAHFKNPEELLLEP